MIHAKPGTFERWAAYRARYAAIVKALQSGYRVTLGTYTRATTYDARHLGMFSCDRFGCYVARGKRRDDIMLCSLVVHP